MLGALAMIVLLRMPVCGDIFVEELYASAPSRDREKVIYIALLEAASRLQENGCAQRLRHEIDEVKGPLKSHGFSTVLLRLCVLRKFSRGAITLGAGSIRYAPQKLSRKVHLCLYNYPIRSLPILSIRLQNV